ncbi:MAG: hypothetical protein QXO70_04570 [Candidatus Pacearchaeota archaeon]
MDKSLEKKKPQEIKKVEVDSEKIAELIKVNLETVERPTFPRIKIMPGGANIFKLPPNLTGEIEETKTITGIILHIQRIRGYWENAYSGGNKPPECSSIDGKVGIENKPEQVRRNCAMCEFSRFGTKGRGQACKEMRRIFIRIKKDLVPSIITVPPTSLSIINNFLVRLVSEGLKYIEIKVIFELQSAKNADGIEYSKLNIYKSKEELTEEEKITAKMMRDGYMKFMGTEPIDISDIGGDSEIIEENPPF